MNSNGFLPLIEAFLAFALTMLALTTAVAAIVGVWQRLFRWRSRGLRHTVEYLYRQALQPRLERRGVRRNPAEWDDSRRQFIVDMTMVPVPRIDKKRAGPTNWQLQSLKDAEASRFFGWWKSWRSLRYGLDWLSDTEFSNRFAESAAHAEIAARANPKAAEDLLLQRFTASGHAATESFARRSRVLTIIIGFLFVFGVNIDSIHLFNSYLTDPNLRKQIIESQEEILKGSQNAAANSSTIDDSSTKIDTAISELSSITESMQAAIDDAIDSDLIRNLRGALEIAEATTTHLEAARSELDEIAKDSTEINTAITSVRSIAVGVTQTFPVGWNQYPNCSTLSSDARCVMLFTANRIPEMEDIEQQVSIESGINGDANIFVTIVKLPWRTAVWVKDQLAPAYEADTAMFWRWFVGVLLTGIMVGLGTPFWVRTVNGALAARNWVQKGERATVPSPPATGDGVPSATAPRTGASPPGKDIDEMMKVARAAADGAPTSATKPKDEETSK